MGEVNFDLVRCYRMLGKHADYVLSAKQRPQKLKCSADFYFFGEC